MIRHKHDYGIVILADERFRNPKNKQEISHWMRDRILVHATYPQLVRDMDKFYTKIESMNLIT